MEENKLFDLTGKKALVTGLVLPVDGETQSDSNTRVN